MDSCSSNQSEPHQAQQFSRRGGCVSIFESFRDGFLGLEERIRSQCSDDPRKSNHKSSRKGKKITIREKKMTPDWGPSHTLDEDDWTAFSPAVEEWHPRTPDNLKERDSEYTPETAGSTPERDERSRNGLRNPSGFSESFSHTSYLASNASQSHQNSTRKGTGRFPSSKANLSKIVETASAAVSSGMNAIRDPRTSIDKVNFTSLHGSCAPCAFPQPVSNTEQTDHSAYVYPTRDYESKDKSKDISSRQSALERRRGRHHRQRNSSQSRQKEKMQVQSQKTDKKTFSESGPSFWQRPDVEKENKSTLDPFPIQTLSIKKSEYIELSDSISELTMQSNNVDSHIGVGEGRRMAYYAVGKRHDGTGRQRGGGNRRCYFSGKLIGTDVPFYAGSVQQGLRTLVVFCLPRALGLPKSLPKSYSARSTSSIKKKHRKNRNIQHCSSTSFSNGSSLLDHTQILNEDSTVSSGIEVENIPDPSLESLSYHTSLDSTTNADENHIELRLSKKPEEREKILQTLPEPNQNLLDEMQVRFPEQFSTLPIQVRSPNCWRLYVRFCFFSGLPIAEGELHYKVKDEIINKVYGEEIVLSHEVMEAVNGEDSAGILRLPNTKTFKYLKKHYVLQCGKLTVDVFDRRSWEIVLAEF